MLFNSLDFLIFFPVVTGLYFLSPHRFRWAILLGASCLFYMAFIPKYILVLLALILIDYISALWMENAPETKKKFILWVSLVSNIGILFVFKYFNFFSENVAAFLSWGGLPVGTHTLDWILPIGLSFHTFQSLSYTIEVYRGEQKAERHLGIYALYVMFYPQLVAGPIERPQNLLHQFKRVAVFNGSKVISGLHLMAWGFFKKMVLADGLAVIADPVFTSPTGYAASRVALAAYAFTFQIYFDFSGYSDIARGAARVMGIDLMKNFDSPFLARSISEFWQRWHISLSTWFKDYLYVPLALSSRGNIVLQSFFLFVVFLISGLWHGANWTFVVWGGFHGLCLALSRPLAPLRFFLGNVSGFSRWQRLLSLAQQVWTFHLVVFGFIFFRAANWEKALEFFRQLLSGIGGFSVAYSENYLPMDFWGLWPLVAIVLCLEGGARLRAVAPVRMVQSVWFRWGAYSLYLALFCLFVVSNDLASQNFIYFQF